VPAFRADLAAAVDDDERRHVRVVGARAIGVVNVYADASERYPTTTLPDAKDLVPDLVVAPMSPIRSASATCMS